MGHGIVRNGKIEAITPWKGSWAATVNNTTHGGKPYYEQTICAERWKKCIDYGSPTSAWTSEMLNNKSTENPNARNQRRT